MNEVQARSILNSSIEDDKLFQGNPFYMYSPADSKVVMDGEFTTEQLEAIAWWMTNSRERPSCKIVQFSSTIQGYECYIRVDNYTFIGVNNEGIKGYSSIKFRVLNLVFKDWPFLEKMITSDDMARLVGEITDALDEVNDEP